MPEQNETLGQIAAHDGRKAEKGLDATLVEQELQQATLQKDARPVPYDEWDPAFLADYIVNTHHSYVRKSLPDIRAYTEKVFQVHGGRHPELQAVFQRVTTIHNELLGHLEKEEKILFPLIRAGNAIPGPIQRMELEHEEVGQLMAEIRTLTNDFTLPEDACATYSLLYRMLEEFEEDLHLHVHLENNILFPKALAAKP